MTGREWRRRNDGRNGGDGIKRRVTYICYVYAPSPALPNPRSPPKINATGQRRCRGVSVLRQSAVSFQTAGLSFEGVIAQPDAAGGPWPGVVLCHPHPLHGGSMHNNVVMALALGLAEEGFVTLRFNFRGVGDSQGEHGQGETEDQEVLGALDLIKAWPDTAGKTGLVGYSFGAGVILRHEAAQKEADALALISPALRYAAASPLKTRRQPALVATGDRDRLVEPEQLAAELQTFAQPPECRIFDGVDHFWYGHEARLVTEVARFFTEQLK